MGARGRKEGPMSEAPARVGRAGFPADHAGQDCHPCPSCLRDLGRPGCPDCRPCAACKANLEASDDPSPFDHDKGGTCSEFCQFNQTGFHTPECRPPSVDFDADEPEAYHFRPHPDDYLFSDDYDRVERAERAARRASLVDLAGRPVCGVSRVDGRRAQ